MSRLSSVVATQSFTGLRRLLVIHYANEIDIGGDVDAAAFAFGPGAKLARHRGRVLPLPDAVDDRALWRHWRPYELASCGWSFSSARPRTSSLSYTCPRWVSTVRVER